MVTHMCLETQEMRDMHFFFFLGHNIYCDACVFFGALCRAFIFFFFFLGCVATHAFFFLGHILKIMGWV